MKLIISVFIVVLLSSCSISMKLGNTSNKKTLLEIPATDNVSIKLKEKVAVEFKNQKKSIEFIWF